MLKKIYTSLLILFVILSLYSIGLTTFTLADAFLLFLFPIYFIDLYRKKTLNIHVPLTLVSFYIILHMLVILFIYNDFEIFMPTMRFVGYLLFFALFVRSYFDLSLGWRLLKITSIISTIFLIVQFFLMNYFNFYLSGFVPGIPLVNNELSLLGDQLYLNNINRPRSFFQEPAHYASFVLVYFCISLFFDFKANKFGLIFIGVGLIVSGSLTGILTAAGLIILRSMITIIKLPKKI
ncbi:hypothetical protein NDQ53_16435 [Rossellomorea marisflavi]|uniref:hypothetical protein n=1 Tax=Rossellomorea marisflavi TaxID=189381 RepID=UPI0020422CAF|nr:hypothetical protein [Rossellomorea marisflavi]MCM2590891.1 hypothetical protein [Rossellomorea marisflavi]